MSAMKYISDPKTLTSTIITTTYYSTIFDINECNTSKFLQKNADGSIALFSVSMNRYSKRIDNNNKIKEETNFLQIPACEKCSKPGEFLVHFDGPCPGSSDLVKVINVPTCKKNILPIIYVHEPNCGCSELVQKKNQFVKFVPNKSI